jgi:predicted nucleic acid-binding protein
MPLLLDTGVLYALADADDAWHDRAVRLIRRTREPFMTPAPIVPEAAYLMRARLGVEAERRFVESIAAKELAVEHLGPADWARAAAWMAERPDIGFVDASVVAIAERLRLARIATTDRRHFASITPRHRDRFELVP